MSGLDRLLVEPPPLLFKYMSNRFSQSALEARQLHFKSPLAFNDPFDCRPRVVVPRTRVARERLLKRDRERVRGGGDEAVADASLRDFMRMGPDELKKVALEAWRSNLTGYGVTCFSEDPLNHLLWAHYADSHRGICVGYRSPALPDSPDGLLLKVFYETERPPFRFPRGRTSSSTDTLAALNTKSSHWSYEREWRCIVRDGADRTIELARDAVECVILGAEVSKPTACEIKGWLASGYPNAKLLRARYSEDTYELALLAEA